MKKMLTLLMAAAISLPMAHHAMANKTKKPQQTETSKNTQALESRDTVYNFGKIEQGKPVTTSFEWVNAGSKVMAITDVTASCGCTTPTFSKAPILPGKTTQIQVGYNAASVGSFYKSITVNYSNGSTKNFYIQGEVMAKNDGATAKIE